MCAIWRTTTTAQPAGHLRGDRRPAPTLAFGVSLVVHALLVFLLYRAYNELANPLQPALQLVTRAQVIATPTPVFAVATPTEPEVEDRNIQPAARALPLARRATPLAEVALVRREMPMPSLRRTTTEASLPVIAIDLPDVLPEAAASLIEPSNSATATAPVAPLTRVSTLEVSAAPRLAPRPSYGPTGRHEVGLAWLTANEPSVSRGDRRPTAAFAHRLRVDNLPTANATTIDRGLAYLARVQLDDGSWQFDNLRGTVDASVESVGAGDSAAATGLALLAFLGAGRDHYDGRYRHVVADGLRFLVQIERQHGEFLRDGELPPPQIMRFYSHGIATLALCEAHGMTGDLQLREPAQRALDYLAGAHHPGIDGWRYLPGLDCDASVIGWQLAALRSGKLAGLHVREATIERMNECLAVSRVASTEQKYVDQTPLPGDQALRGASSRTVTTAVELAVDLHLGGGLADERQQTAARELLAHPPEVSDALAAQGAASDSSQRDTYYWYYGSQAMHSLGGEGWQEWSRQLFPQLAESQIRAGQLAGSWDPIRTGTAGRARYGGRLYVSAMNLLSLETQIRQPPVDGNSPRTAARPQ